MTIRSHFGPQEIGPNRMARYALCKHGPHCHVHGQGRCGFAHRIAEVTLPDRVWDRRFVDDSDKREGLAGIDIWFGQRYNLAQHSRICLYVEYEGPPFPDWVRMYLWFHDKVRDVPSVYEEFNLLTRIREDLLDRMGKWANNAPTTVLELQAWSPPFQWAEDQYDCPFPEKLFQYCEHRLPYEVLLAVAPTIMEEYRADTSYHWGPDSRRYLDLVQGDKYLFIDVSKGAYGAGWYWVAEHDNVHVCGWAAPRNLEHTGTYQKYHRLQAGQMYPLEHEWASPDTCTNGLVSRSMRFTRIAPDGTDLQSLSRLAVCYSDASVDDRQGFAVCWLCRYMTVEESWALPSCSRKQYVRGAEAGELAGCILVLCGLDKRVNDWQNAMVYCDSSNLVKHIGDHDREPVLPSTPAGWILYPLIQLAVRELRALKAKGKYVMVKHLPREHNICDACARQCMSDARKDDWRSPMGTSWWSIDQNSGLVKALDEVSDNLREIEARSTVKSTRDSHEVS